MKLNIESIVNDKQAWLEKGIILPEYDIEAVRKRTAETPEWIHIGGGNVFRAYIACLADDMIKSGVVKTGIISVSTHDPEMIDKAYKPYDNLALLVGLRAEGGRYLRVIGSVADALTAIGSGLTKLKKIARNASLKMISFTITEKGYACRDMNGNVFEGVQKDIENGPSGNLNSAMSIVAAMMYERFRAGGAPIALVSMDNCRCNGKKLCEGVTFVAQKWREKGFVPAKFINYLNDKKKVSFPWSMIDKITPRPDSSIANELTALGIEDMQPFVTPKKVFIAPFVNAEMPQYLVIEDNFPNGRPPLEVAGVFMTDRETVNRVEKMKVMTCLNPLHTALAIFGCLLGFRKIADEMNDRDLKELVYRLGYNEGLPVVVNPGIIKPEEFLKEVLEERLPNPYLPDTPQRIATDTSQKLAIRFGGTIKAYEERGDADTLRLIPLVIAGWLRYLTGIDDEGNPMELSADPMLEELRKTITSDMFGNKVTDRDGIKKILSNTELFGTDLVNAGLADRIIDIFEEMLSVPGAVRKALAEATK